MRSLSPPGRRRRPRERRVHGFAHYLCMGEGSNGVFLCMRDYCGTKSPLDSVFDIDFTEGQNLLIIRALFDYWYAPPANGLESNQTPDRIK